MWLFRMIKFSDDNYAGLTAVIPVEKLRKAVTANINDAPVAVNAPLPLLTNPVEDSTTVVETKIFALKIHTGFNITEP